MQFNNTLKNENNTIITFLLMLFSVIITAQEGTGARI